MKARIIATGSYYAEIAVDNNTLANVVDTNDEWIIQRTGISERRFSNYNTTDLAYFSALDILKNSSLDKDELDLIIVATFSPEDFTPSCANQVKKKLELKSDIPSFDLNAACSGFVYGLKVAQAFIQSGMYKNIMLIGAENISKHLDFNDRSSSILFGDGAAGVILQANSIGIIDTDIFSRDDNTNSILVPTGVAIDTPFNKNEKISSSRLQMKGQDVFRFATKVLVSSIKDMLTKHNLTTDDIKYFVAHQANKRIIEYAVKTLKVDSKKFVINLDKVGNTSAASVPLVLDDINKAAMLNKGDKIIIVAFGSGLTYGVSLIEW